MLNESVTGRSAPSLRPHPSNGLACLFAAVAIGWLAVAPIAGWFYGAEGVIQAFVAAVICVASGAVALLATGRFFRSQQALAGMLSAMAARSIPPLTICLLLAIGDLGDRAVGFVAYLLVFYMVALAAETYAAVRLVKTAP